MSLTMTNELFLAQFRHWIREMRRVASEKPGTGACTLASGMELWLWSLNHLLYAQDALGKPLYKDQRQGVTFPMADALSWLLASRYQILDVLELETAGRENSALGEALPGIVQFLSDLCHVQAVRASGEVARICSQLVYSYNRHPEWGDPGACVTNNELIAAESLVPGAAAGIAGSSDVTSEDGAHPVKAGPCVHFDGMETFQRLHSKLSGCYTGSALAKDRAATALTKVTIPEALDYPM
jgi:hypothetical protein